MQAAGLRRHGTRRGSPVRGLVAMLCGAAIPIHTWLGRGRQTGQECDAIPHTRPPGSRQLPASRLGRALRKHFEPPETPHHSGCDVSLVDRVHSQERSTRCKVQGQVVTRVTLIPSGLIASDSDSVSSCLDASEGATDPSKRQSLARGGRFPRRRETLLPKAHAVTMGDIPSLERFQVLPNGKSRVNLKIE